MNNISSFKPGIAISTCALGVALPLTLSADPVSARPNIIFILADDMGYGELTCYNPEWPVHTPNIDRLAEKGVRMTQAYASPVSSPTRTAFLTGAYPQRVGVYGNYDGEIPGIGPFRKAFPEVLQSMGYRTGWFGKWHQGLNVENHPLNNGFDVGFGFLGGMHDYYEPSVGAHQIGGPYSPNAFVYDQFRPVTEMDYLTDEITEHAISFIEQSKEEPFFAYLAYNAPHTPIEAPDHAILKYLKEGMDPVAATRLAMVDVLDANIGRVLATLERTGLDKNTLVVFMSDNGAERQSFNGGFRGTKMTVWEGGIRVPMIARFPGVIPQGTVSESICSIMDLATTFITLANPDRTDSYGDGVNLMPYWCGTRKGNAHDSLIFSIHVTGKVGARPTVDNLDLLGVRHGDWKLVRDRKRKIDALYNLRLDPAESKDLSAVHPQKKEELLDEISALFRECPPGCGRIVSQNTRAMGDSIRNEALRKHCRLLLEQRNVEMR